nr:hypothetical protein [Saprospiraceae bacterium]
MGMLFCLAVLNSCGPTEAPPFYYFPPPDTDEGYVYQYESLTDGFPDEYWHISKGAPNQLKICVFDELRGWGQCSFEYMTSTGMLQDSLWIFTDQNQPQFVEILHGNLYPSKPLDSKQVYLQYLRWYSSPDSLTFTEIIRNRRYQPLESSKKQVVFQVLEVIEDFQEGYLQMEMKGKEVFEPGLGLVYFEKEITEEVSRKYTFSGRISVEDFRRKTNAPLLTNR